MYSVEFLPDLVQIQLGEIVKQMAEDMRRSFNEHQLQQLPSTENQLGSEQMTEEVSELVGMNYSGIVNNRYVAQPVNDFFFPCKEARPAENPGNLDDSFLTK